MLSHWHCYVCRDGRVRCVKALPALSVTEATLPACTQSTQALFNAGHRALSTVLGGCRLPSCRLQALCCNLARHKESAAYLQVGGHGHASSTHSHVLRGLIPWVILPVHIPAAQHSRCHSQGHAALVTDRMKQPKQQRAAAPANPTANAPACFSRTACEKGPATAAAASCCAVLCTGAVCPSRHAYLHLRVFMQESTKLQLPSRSSVHGNSTFLHCTCKHATAAEKTSG
jgi:hypothetical protein